MRPWHERAEKSRQLIEARRREVRPGSSRIAFVVKELVEESLPTTQSVDGDCKRELALIHGIGELVEIKHPVVASVRRHHDIDPQVSEDQATPRSSGLRPGQGTKRAGSTIS